MGNVYDLLRSPVIEAFNCVAQPLGVGGAFHVAVEVWGLEYSYGFKPQPSSGIYSIEPRKEKDHHYRESVELGVTKCSQSELQSFLIALAPKFKGCNYHWCSLNCCTFVREFAALLGVGPVPNWADNLSRAMTALSSPVSGTVAALENLALTCKPIEGPKGPCGRIF